MPSYIYINIISEENYSFKVNSLLILSFLPAGQMDYDCDTSAANQLPLINFHPIHFALNPNNSTHLKVKL
jgi:hypothetical protein